MTEVPRSIGRLARRYPAPTALAIVSALFGLVWIILLPGCRQLGLGPDADASRPASPPVRYVAPSDPLDSVADEEAAAPAPVDETQTPPSSAAPAAAAATEAMSDASDASDEDNDQAGNEAESAPPRAKGEEQTPSGKPGFAGPLPWKGWVRTTIFGRYDPLRSLFRGERYKADGGRYYHQGVDILAPVGTPLVAPADGTVVRAGSWNASGYGNVVLMRVAVGGRNLYVLYAHMQKVTVKAGQKVKRGQVVGAAGKSGNAARMPKREEHVHVEVRTAEKVGSGLSGRIDPLDYFTAVITPKELKTGKP